MTPTQLRALRLRLGMTQAEFSAVYRVPLRALQNWEQGRFAFLPSIDTLLTLIEREPETIARILSE